jgi:hypothetical protein
MDAGAEFEARSEAIVFLGFLADFPDPRQPGKVIYPLEGVFLLCQLAVLAGAAAGTSTWWSRRSTGLGAP